MLSEVARSFPVFVPSPARPRGVLLLNEAFVPLVDGVINVVDNLYHSLRERGVFTHVVTTTQPGYVDTHESITRLPSSFLSFSAPYRLPLPCNVFRRLPMDLADRVDVVHLHSGFTHAHAVMKWARYHRKPVVFTVHTKFEQKFQGALGGPLGRVVAGVMYERLLSFIKQADMITCPGEIFSEELLASGVPKNKLRLVRNGISDWPTTAMRDLSEDPIAKRVMEARRAGKAILLFVGQHIREKNPHLLLEALAKLKARGVPFFCFFVGGGDQTRALMVRARKLGIRDDVLFVGRVFDRARLSMFYGMADLMTFPSTFETSGLVLMEAAQHGLATVGITGSSGISEIVRDGENGFLAPLDASLYAERIARALADEVGLARIRKQVRLSLARSKDVMVEEFLSLYGELCVRH